MVTRQFNFWRFISLHVWGALPGNWQRNISKIYARLYDKKFSKYFIEPYCRLNYNDPEYLSKFRPGSGADSYQNFQDFFTRAFKDPPIIQAEAVWACEGLLCEYGRVDEFSEVCVKGEKRHMRTIFGEDGVSIPDSYYFSNIFLHTKNYHRIHSPVTGKVIRIEHIPGDLVVLRPWIYKNDPSQPALRNERINVDIEGTNGKRWYLSIVGGPAVGTIILSEVIRVGYNIQIAEEIAKFLLGSTCCIASPIPAKQHLIGKQVSVGDPL